MRGTLSGVPCESNILNRTLQAALRLQKKAGGLTAAGAQAAVSCCKAETRRLLPSNTKEYGHDESGLEIPGL